jgi:UDP-glucose 4-epimerase
MKKVLVTGGSGFIGSHIMAALEKRGIETINVDFQAQDDSKRVTIKKYAGALTDKDVDGVDTVFHFGSPCSVLLFKQDPLGSMQNATSSALHIFELAKTCGFTVIYPSSGNVYMPAPNPTDEHWNTFPNNLYAVSKIYTEQLAAYYRETFDVASTGLRIFLGYGPGEETKGDLASVITLFAKDMMAGKAPKMWGSGEQRRDAVYIDDIVELAIKCGSNPKTSILNVGSGKSYSYNEIVAMINKFAGTSIEPIHVPKPNDYVDNTLADTSLAAKLYGFVPTPLAEGLRRHIQYLGKVYKW